MRPPLQVPLSVSTSCTPSLLTTSSWQCEGRSASIWRRFLWGLEEAECAAARSRQQGRIALLQGRIFAARQARASPDWCQIAATAKLRFP